MFLEINVIQNFSAVNLNRDDANAIKTINFGGYERQRVSSQCFKRAMRDHYSANTARNGDEVFRTKAIYTLLCKKLDLDCNDEYSKIIVPEFMKELGLGNVASPLLDSKKKRRKEPFNSKLSTLFFTSEEEVQHAADCMKKHQSKRKFDPAKAANEFRENKEKFSAKYDIALFGRMAASGKNLNVEAAAQVAHSISTNEIIVEDDYFTAIDDLASKEETATNMIGNTQLASPCFYRYACLSLNTLKENLGDTWEKSCERVLSGFLESFIKAIPSGKSKSTAPHSLPSFVLISIGNTQPISLVNAFEKPIYPSQETGLALASTQALLHYLNSVDDFYDWSGPRKAFYGTVFESLQPDNNALEHKKTLKDLIAASVAACKEVAP